MTSKERYIDIFPRYKHLIPIYYHPQWLDAVRGSQWNIELFFSGDDLLGIMPYSLKSKMGLKAIFSPFLTPYQGIYLLETKATKQSSIYSKNFETIHDLINRLPKFQYYQIPFHYRVKYGFPMIYQNFDVKLRYTYLLEDIKDHDKIFENFKSSLKNKIRKSSKNLSVEVSEDVELLYQLINKTFDRQDLKNPTPFSVFKNITSNPQINTRIYFAKDHKNIAYAAHLVVWDELSAYNLAIGVDSEFADSGAVPLLLWHSIKDMSQYVDVYDFEGSIIPGVQVFFESFGGKAIPYFQFIKASNRFLDLAFRFFKKY